MSSETPSTLSTLSSHEEGSDRTQMTIVKRHGAIVPFRRERIYQAVEAAFRDTKRIPKGGGELQESVQQHLTAVTDAVCAQAADLVDKQLPLTVEGVQDFVEIALMEQGFHDVARDYIIYRNQHKALRSGSGADLKVWRESDRSYVRFNPIKLSSLIEKLIRLHHLPSQKRFLDPSEIDLVNGLTQKSIEAILTHAEQKGTISTTQIEELLEELLMREGHFAMARACIFERAKAGDSSSNISTEIPTENTHFPERRPTTDQEKSFKMVDSSGNASLIAESKLLNKIDYVCHGFQLPFSAEQLLEMVVRNFYEGMAEAEIDKSFLMTFTPLIEQEPAFSKVCARVLLSTIYQELMQAEVRDRDLDAKHRETFIHYIAHGISIGRLSQEMGTFNLKLLAQALDLERDNQFQYLGLQTLYDRYFIHEDGKRLETPQIFWMRVAMGLALREGDKKELCAIEFYHVLSTCSYIPGTPTLFNSGTCHSQLSSCYLLTVMDDLDHIFKTVSDNAKLSKWAGGLGNDWTNVRGTRAHIKGTNGQSQGVTPFLKVVNDTVLAVNQGGKRKGALCAYLETWHIDIEEFLELRKNTGDERRRTHDMHTANWIPDLFMKRVRQNGSWTLFSPDEVSDLHDLYGAAFEKRYVHYEQEAKQGRIRLFKQVDALTLWRKMLGMLFETGHPWITFKDPSNIRSPQDHVGVIHSSNLCTEILLNTSKEESAVCNLGSINLVAHMKDGQLDDAKLASSIRTAMRMLDNVIDLNFYPIEETRKSNHSHRAVGLGLMGFQDCLHQCGISYASPEAVAFADESMEKISYHAILSSSELAKERNPYPSYKGSKWERGLLPIDTIDLLEKERGETVEMDRSTTMDWSIVRDSIKKYGMRNSNTLAIAPTATIANICGVNASIEPNYKNLYVKSNLSGDFTICNPYLVARLKEEGLWDEEMLDDLKYFEGSIQEIDRIPDEIKSQFPTAFEIPWEYVVDSAAGRQKWIDQGQSLNLYVGKPDGKNLHNMYMTIFAKGLKTTYYCRTLSATRIEMSTVDINKRKIQPRWMKHDSPSSRLQIPRKLEKGTPSGACSLDEGCESCQ